MGDIVNFAKPAKKKRRHRGDITANAALEIMREASVDGVFTVASRTELARVLKWERTRASKALDRWVASGAVLLDEDKDGKLLIRVMPGRTVKMRGKGTGVTREKPPVKKRSPAREIPAPDVRENTPREDREVIQNPPVGSKTSQVNENPADTITDSRPDSENTAAPGPGNTSTPTPELPPAPTSSDTANPSISKDPRMGIFSRKSAAKSAAATVETPPSPAPAETHLPRYASHEIERADHVYGYIDHGRAGQGAYRSRPVGFLDVVVSVCAVALTSVAAIMSVGGMMVLFGGTPAIALMLGCSLESAKIATAAWVGSALDELPGGILAALIGFIICIAAINAVSVYSQLVASHLAVAGAEQVALERDTATANSRISVAQGKVSDLDRQIASIDTLIDGAASRGRTKQAIRLMQNQQRERANLVQERDKARREVASLQAGQATGQAQHKATMNEALPIQYVAELLGIHKGGEEVIRWLIAGIVAVTDPFALVLAFALNSRRRRRSA